MRSVFALSLLAVLAGCSSPAASHPFVDDYDAGAFTSTPASPTVYDFEGAWTGSERELVTAGFAEWPLTVHETLHVWRVSADVTQSAHCPPFDEVPGHGRMGYTAGADVCIYMNENNAATLGRTAAHEYGHALGLPHYTGTQPSMMFADFDEQSPVVAAVDVADVDELDIPR